MSRLSLTKPKRKSGWKWTKGFKSGGRVRIDPKAPTVVLTVRITKDQREKLDRHAKVCKVTLGYVIRDAIEGYFDSF